MWESYTKEGDPGCFFNDFYMWRHVPELTRFAFEGPCAELAERAHRGAPDKSF